MSTLLPGRFGHVDLDDLDLLEAEDEELGSFDNALAEMPRSDPPPRSIPPAPDSVG